MCSGEVTSFPVARGVATTAEALLAEGTNIQAGRAPDSEPEQQATAPQEGLVPDSPEPAGTDAAGGRP